ncbi:MAG: ShlB/FhaC/HecB family hemolysin secretion/activation protein, partial [Gammaproteobacteria bacterium]|nr:ShlB/FhaC/HecB family hemolysin secretion/activation protein [Gammaproteobacteria bacterium]
RFEVSGENPLSDAETQTILERFTGQHAGLEGLLEAVDALQAAIKERGTSSFSRVVLPQQTLQGGVVRLEVIVLTVSKVNVTGATHHSEKNIRNSVPALVEGVQPSTRKLARTLELANLNASKETTLTFKENEAMPGTLEGTLDVEDKRPWNVFASGDNSGSSEIGTAQITLGASHDNLFNMDHVGSLSYTTAPEDADRLKLWAGSYYAPVYSWGGAFLLYYVESDVDTGLVLDAFEVSGAGKFGGVRYSQEFYHFGSLKHRVTIGFDDKLFENNVLLGTSNLGSDVRAQPASLQYSGEIESYPWSTSFYISYARNLPGNGRNSTPFYEANRAGATEDWDVSRGGGTLSYNFSNGLVARGALELQYSDEPLIAGEQFGLGGAHSVRGFEEREISGDSGTRLSAEIWSPPIELWGDLRFLGFIDGGEISREGTPVSTGPRDDDILSYGAGLRWQWKEYVGVSLDVGHVVEEASVEDNSSGTQAHFAMLVRF